MRVQVSLVLALVAFAAAAVPAEAQSRRGAYSIRDKIKEGWAKKRAARSGSSEPAQPNANASGFFIPQGNQPKTTTPATGPKAFPTVETLKKATSPAPSSAPTGGGSAATVAPPRPPPRPQPPIVPGLRAPGVRRIETPEDLEEYEAVERVRKAASVRMAVSRAARADDKLTEVGLVQQVLGALDMPAPENAQGLRQTGLQVRPGRLEAGDLLFFQIPHGGKITDHVAVFFGDDRFAYVGPRGVSLAPLDDTWRRRLLMVRRPR